MQIVQPLDYADFPRFRFGFRQGRPCLQVRPTERIGAETVEPAPAIHFGIPIPQMPQFGWRRVGMKLWAMDALAFDLLQVLPYRGFAFAPGQFEFGLGECQEPFDEAGKKFARLE